MLPSGDPSLCAVTALDSYLATQGPTERTPFRLQTATLTRQRLNHFTRDLASRCGVESQWYSSHSFSIGAASAAAAACIPDWRLWMERYFHLDLSYKHPCPIHDHCNIHNPTLFWGLNAAPVACQWWLSVPTG